MKTIRYRVLPVTCLALLVSALLPWSAHGQGAGDAKTPRPNLESTIQGALRYRPDGSDFVIENGAESFNRPLYGRNTAFRVDGGDKPEFVMYLPGRGGNLRLGLKTPTVTKWLQDAARITTRYRPGELLYEVRDPALGVHGVLRLQVLALDQTDGLILRALLTGIDHASTAVELIAAYGGVNGERGARDGDIGTEAVPISQWFQLQPQFCRDNSIALTNDGFELNSSVARIAGIAPQGAKISIADARQWADMDALLSSSASEQPVAVVRFELLTNKPSYLTLQRIEGGNAAATELDTYKQVSAASSAQSIREAPQAALPPRYTSAQLPRIFANAQQHFKSVREQIVVHTPDAYINAAVGALNIAADAVWDEPQGAVMHGAIAWRARLLGWRGTYVMDALGWHERARRNLSYWASRQNIDPVPDGIPAAEAATNLSRNPQALHSNGDISNSHYDMNTVYIDAVFRHLLWTGNMKFARSLWPVIERHLAWERRLFRREFGPEHLPLYEAYATIWASDDLQYNGGGVAYASAYNWWHNVMAAKLARLLDVDAKPYELEAALIRRAMNEYLWLPEQGMFAEYRDYLGLQLAHPSAGLWSFYHVLDAPGLVSARQAWQMSRYVDAAIPHLPVRAAGLDGADYHVMSTTHWLPYTWSTNNVVMGENIHAALGYWQVGRDDEAFTLFKSALLASMYMGICPGNVGTMNYLDVYRREAQRDFADGAGVTARALVEGLFGIRPDALNGVIDIKPGWPTDWPHASLRTPTLELSYQLIEHRAKFAFASRIPGLRKTHLRLPMLHESVQRITVNGHEIQPRISTDELQRRWLDIDWTLQANNTVVVQWRGPPTPISLAQIDTAAGVHSTNNNSVSTNAPSIYLNAAHGEFAPVDLTHYFNDRVTEIFKPGKYVSPRSAFASLAIPAQGIGAWAGHVNAMAQIDDNGLRRIATEHDGEFMLPNGVPFITPGVGTTPNIIFTSQWDNYPHTISVVLQGHARQMYLLMAGSTNHMQSQFDNGEVVVTYVDGSTTRLALRNPTNWWPIDQDYFIDDYQFRRPEPIPLRVDLKTGMVRVLDLEDFKGHGGVVPGGAATVLELPLDETRELRSLKVGALANEVVIGLMAVTLIR
jgi:hypothetical protein